VVKIHSIARRVPLSVKKKLDKLKFDKLAIDFFIFIFFSAV